MAPKRAVESYKKGTDFRAGAQREGKPSRSAAPGGRDQGAEKTNILIFKNS
jgi:hypothetical protein